MTLRLKPPEKSDDTLARIAASGRSELAKAARDEQQKRLHERLRLGRAL